MTKPRLTDMDIKQQTVASLEYHWDETPDDLRAEQILNQEKAQQRLTRLAKGLTQVRDKAALESYHQAYNQTLQVTNPTTTLSLESYPGVITKKTVLAKSISDQIESLGKALEVAMESYAKDIDSDFKELLTKYQKVHRSLKATDADIDDVEKKSISVNHTRAFDMLMVNNVFHGKEPVTAIQREASSLQRLTNLVGKAVARLTKDVGELLPDDTLDRSSRDIPNTPNSINLMFNRKVKIEDGQVDSETRKTRKPGKSYSWGQWAWIIFGGFAFSHAGMELGKVLVGNKKDSEAKVSNNLKEVHKYIRVTQGLDEIVEDLQVHVQALTKLFARVEESQESALNRRSVPIMELAYFIMKQIIDVTQGADSLFTKLVRKHSK